MSVKVPAAEFHATREQDGTLKKNRKKNFFFKNEIFLILVNKY